MRRCRPARRAGTAGRPPSGSGLEIRRPSMLTFPWPTLDRWPLLPAHTRRLVEAVRSGRGGELFPPGIRSWPEGVELDARALAGPRDAGLIAAALAQPRLVPLVARIEQLGAWCEAAAARSTELIAPRVLAVDNP